MILDYNKIDPELLAAIRELPALNINRDNIARIRQTLAAQPKPPSTVSVLGETHSIPTPDGAVTVQVYRKSDRKGQPAVLWIHGGGYILGSAEDERARVIAATLDCTVCSVDYRLAPEHPFPAGSNDCYAALEWLFTEADALGIDASRVAIGGASAGGGMAAGLALMNRDKANHTLVFQLLIYPMIDNLHATESGRYENHPIWNQGTSFNAWEMYLDGTPGEQASPYAAAARATDLTGLPPAYICVGSEDLFRDEDLEYARALVAANVPTEIAVFPGMYHGGEGFVPQAAVSKRLTRSFMAALGDALR
ncbi:MAG: alpha/beta hydrolase [Proteobacteria bacterium]|jgi:acetyl esterase|nr:alpha/beta hydrolase [Pseudomonadota bacterium]MDA1300780.1 alpha/beta hydrolase [Pseudomonadota bacterium]